MTAANDTEAKSIAMTGAENPKVNPPSPGTDVTPSTLPPENAPPTTQPKTDPIVSSRTRVILDCLFMMAGMVTYVADLGTDILVAVQYVVLDEYAWSGLTIIFIIIPSLTIQYFSFRWFIVDSKQNTKTKHVPFLKKVADWILWVIFHVLQLGVLKRYWRTVKYGWRSQHKPDYYDLSVYEYRDITMLRLLESFMESAPQLVLQVYIMTQQEDIYWLTVTSAIVSLASLAWGIEAYHKALRESCSNKNNLGYVGLTVRMAWRTFTITARVISLALFAAFNKWIFIPLVAIHYISMTLWLIYQDTDFCTTRLEEVLFDAVIGIIHIFCFFNMKEGRTRYRALFFYTIILIENSVMFALWYHYRGREEVYGLPALIFVWGGFFLGIFIMLFYYRCLHPNGNIRLWGGGASTTKPKSKQTQDGNGPVYDNNGQDEVDGHLSGDKVVLPLSSSRGCHGNLFLHKGRRYCYWRDDGTPCPCDATLANQNLAMRKPEPTSTDHSMVVVEDSEDKNCGCSEDNHNSVVNHVYRETCL